MKNIEELYEQLERVVWEIEVLEAQAVEIEASILAEKDRLDLSA